jgi:ABC-type multidrug transport system fused ATPase/permease subunit
MIVVGCVAGLFRFIQVSGLEIFAFTTAHKIKVQYFKSIMGKDSEWFDSNNPNELATKIVKESTMIYRGIGEKIGDLYGIFSNVLVSYIICFYISWECTFIFLGGVPVVLVAAVITMKAGFAGVKEGMIAYQ